MIDSRLPASDAGGERERAADAFTLTPGPVVLLVDAADAPERAADAAIELATTWAQAGRRIVLADLHLEHPVLHERLGETNRDGVVDIFLYGASLSRSARPVPGRGFYLIPAGTYAADSQAVFGHPRWPKLLAGFRDANASLLLFAPADPATLQMLARWSTEAILLDDAADDAEQRELSLPAGLTLLATLTLPAPAELEEPPVETVAEPEVEVELPPAEPQIIEEEREPAANEPVLPLAAAAPVEPEPAKVPPPPPPPAPAARPEPAPRRRSSVALWLALGMLLLVAAGVVMVYLWPHLVPLADPARRVAEPARVGAAADAPPAAPAAAALPEGSALPYAVHIRAYRSQGAAREQVAAEERRLGDQPVYISPELIQGILYYRLLAGLPADSAAALRLRQRLLDAGAIDAQDATGALDLIRYTPLAFRLGEFTTRSDALERADSLFVVGIPSYPVSLPYSDGSERWLLYGGAYRDSTDADGMRELLARAGLEAPLVERLGRPSDATP